VKLHKTYTIHAPHHGLMVQEIWGEATCIVQQLAREVCTPALYAERTSPLVSVHGMHSHHTVVIMTQLPT